ncbi:hypothetical protein [Actinoplanes sp. NPDC026670]|uniref:pPIWI_RE_Z domain-containing protein n=1 Tax=Actinoplanes sp. NPDC026670 TaxID=3154700 RepID=UPI0033DBBC76
MAAGFPEEIMPVDVFCAVELGLHLLTSKIPGEPVGALQPLLSGYVKVGSGLEPVLRAVRHRMGDVSRRGYWRHLLNQYTRLDAQWRWFERLDDPKQRVDDRTVFGVKRSPDFPDRVAVYDEAMGASLAFRQVRVRRAAEAGQRYWFELDDGRKDYVRFPDRLPVGGVIEPVGMPAARRRTAVDVTFDDLEAAAVWVDGQLKAHPEVDNRNWQFRLREKVRFNAVDPDKPHLVQNPPSFRVDGLSHIVGLMNSGKTTLTDLIAIDRVRRHHERVGIVVGSVADVLAKVSFLRTLGIDAVPLIGASSRTEHINRYWRTMVEESAQLVADDPGAADPAARYTNAACLLEPLRSSAGRNWKALDPSTAPCTGSLRSDDEREWRHDCPLLSVCPVQCARQDIPAARVWVTTPQCLLASRAEPATVATRWLELVQGVLDWLIIDEADSVQQVFDSHFVQTEHLVGGPDGWSHRMVEVTNAALARLHMAPAADDKVQRWYEHLQIHQQAVFGLNRLALSEAGESLRELLGEAPFTAHALWRRVVRALFGLPQKRRGLKEREDRADEFYRLLLQDFAEKPFLPPPTGLEQAVEAIRASTRNDEAIAEHLDAWIEENRQPDVGHGWLDDQRSLLRSVIEAAVWASYITTTFFEMSTMYPSVRGLLQLPDEERFWASQPPRDYRPVVPEAPMGNILALRWAASRNGGAMLQLLWVHGVGRWLLYHAHDLLAAEGIDGPHVILTSATSWTPGSSFYHVAVMPTAVLSQPDEDREALMRSQLTVRNPQTVANPIFVSGRQGVERRDNLRRMVTALCHPSAGRHHSMLEEIRAELPEDRRRVLFVVLSTDEAQVVGEHINNRTPFRARIVVPDAADPGRDGIPRRLVASFGTGADDILVAAELSIQRGYNILNSNDTAALGAVIYLTRSHPPPSDLSFPLSLISQLAMARLQDPPHILRPAFPCEVADLVHQLRAEAREMWFDVIGRPVQFRALARDYVPAFVGNMLVPMSQTIGRSIRGNQPTRVLLCDAAFAPRLATDDEAADTAVTSVVVAMDRFLQTLLAPPRRGASDEQRRLHAVNTAVWGLMGHLIGTNDPLGTQRKASA